MSRAWFEALDAAADGVLIMNPQQRIVYSNKAAKKITGFRDDEMLGSYCHDLLRGCSDRGRPICRDHCCQAAAAAGGQPVESFDMFVHTKSGGIRWLGISTMTWSTNGNGEGRGILHLFRDVTQRKERERLLDQVLDAAQSLQAGEQVDTFPALPTYDLRVSLTDREYEVLSLLAEGLGTHDIALRLFISPSTTRNHIRNLLDKLQVHSRLEAVVLAYKAGLVATR
jgi:PAS domain S-box-containing protein